jgi:hypothetical protein
MPSGRGVLRSCKGGREKKCCPSGPHEACFVGGGLPPPPLDPPTLIYLSLGLLCGRPCRGAANRFADFPLGPAASRRARLAASPCRCADFPLGPAASRRAMSRPCLAAARTSLWARQLRARPCRGFNPPTLPCARPCRGFNPPTLPCAGPCRGFNPPTLSCAGPCRGFNPPTLSLRADVSRRGNPSF